ncbi:monovalent cation/H+ antiporter subunit D [Isoalcanivorax beigongshangi]|uniref:Monovalent cation/H+ antiporter subunit D n=1 Tax=Isoalcanivorax beigongshangi TaxID=3238810 RepID=A0ABV4AEB9_9GAMM
MNLLDHLIMAPILIPLLAGALLVGIEEQWRRRKVSIALGAALLSWLSAMVLLWQADQMPGGVPAMTYLVGNWKVPFGIALVVDRLSALMLVLAGGIFSAALLYSVARWDRVGVHFYALSLFLIAGVNGAFLTHDLFNLFVFFEVMLAASYGLLLHGSGKRRVRHGLRYVAMNLAASSVFLIGVALLYAATGSLNMSDVASKVGQMSATDRHLLETGAAILAVAFLLKAAVWPLNLWLPGSYGAATPPVAAMFAIMTKVGLYVVMRLWLLMFSDEAGVSAGFGGNALLWIGLATLAVATFGLLSAADFRRFAGFSVVASSGTLLAGLALRTEVATTATLYYMLASTLAIGAFFLLIELLERIRDFGANLLAVTQEAFEAEGMVLPEGEDVGVVIPAAFAFLGLNFILCALVLSGLPPLASFVGKFALMAAMLETPDVGQWVFLTLLIVSGLAAVVALMRLGIRLFWVPAHLRRPRLRVIEAAPVAALLVACLGLTVAAGPVGSYLARTAAGLYQVDDLMQSVVGQQPWRGEQP